MDKIKGIDLSPDAPITFACDVEIPTEAGSKALGFTFKHRNREQVAQLRDQHRAEADAAAKAEGDDDQVASALTAIRFALEAEDAVPRETLATIRLACAIETKRSVLETTKDGIAKDVAMLRDLVSGWDMDLPLTDATLRAMCVRYPAAPLAILNAYLAAIYRGRLGN